jgi:hypothetical protein
MPLCATVSLLQGTQRGGEQEKQKRSVPVPLDRSLKPAAASLSRPSGSSVAHRGQPKMGVVTPRTETERFVDMRFRLLRARTYLANPMCACAIAKFRTSGRARSNAPMLFTHDWSPLHSGVQWRMSHIRRR